jgi:uncharacterized protein (DUF2336 family)
MMLKTLIGRVFGKAALPERPSYEQSRAILEERSAELRHQLAGRTGVAPEILYYLASDADAAVRRRVARNPSTPAHADRLLCEDSDDDVRATLARKIGRLLPAMAKEENQRTRDLVLETLDKLARDQLPRVRAIIAEQIKSSRIAPKALALKLAHDAEIQVAAPILEYSPLLSDADLMEIVALAQVSEALAAIAKRKNLSVAVCDAVIATMDIPATAALIGNGAANISKQAMDGLLNRAAEVASWHEPLVSRPNLSARVMRRIASFVSSSLIDRMVERQGLPPDAADELKRSARKSIDQGELDEATTESAAVRRVKEALAHNALDDHFVSVAADSGERETVVIALSTLATAPVAVVRRILEARSGRAISALVWKAKLPMRVAVTIQTSLLKMPARDVLPARGGTDFPLGAAEMTTHLEMFGLSGR